MTEGEGVHAFDMDEAIASSERLFDPLPPARPRRAAASEPALLEPTPPDLAALVAGCVVPELVGRRRAEDGAAPRQAAAADRATIVAFVDLLFDGFGSDCESFAMEMLEATADPQIVAARLLEPAAREVGLRWCSDTGDFLRVTFAVSRLQRLFWRMAQECPPVRKSQPRKTALLAPVPGEQHTFGLSILEDALRRAGWEVDTCVHGEEARMLRLAAANHYRLVGFSLGGEQLLPALAGTIRTLRRKSANREVAVIAGGSLFTRRPLTAAQVGADGVCLNAAAAVRFAEDLLAYGPARCQMPVAAE